MKRVARMPDDELVALYVELGVAQYDALDRFETARFNRLYERKIAVENELRSRPGDQRRLLIALYQHPNKQVQLNAAHSTYALNPAGARSLFEDIRASRWFPQAADAAMALRMIDRGEWKG